jgi:hypothetical protein
MIKEGLLDAQEPLFTIEEKLSTDCQQIVARWVLRWNGLQDVLYWVSYLKLQVQCLKNPIVNLNEVVIKHFRPLLVREQAYRISGIAAGRPHLRVVLRDESRLGKTLNEQGFA